MPQLVTDTAPGPDRLLLVHDVRARLPKNADGTPAYSERWVREHVAPAASRVVGGRWAVNERAFEVWHARWVANALTDADLPTRVRHARARQDAEQGASVEGRRRAS